MDCLFAHIVVPYLLIYVMKKKYYEYHDINNSYNGEEALS